MLRPLVKILLRNQVSVWEFIDQIKDTYVEVAEKDFAIEGKKNTVSRISVITGLSRKDVLRIKTAMENNNHEDSQAKQNKAGSVLTGWLKDKDFTDSKGNAVALPQSGEISFDTLVKRYGGDITTRAVLDELIRNGNVVKNAQSGLLELKTFGYIPERNLEKMQVMSKCARDFFETISHNLERDGHDAFFQRQLAYTELPKSLVDEFREFSKEKSLEHLFELNRWLAEHKQKLSPEDTKDRELYRAGLGIYYIQNNE